jgi:hypothetical protein
MPKERSNGRTGRHAKMTEEAKRKIKESNIKKIIVAITLDPELRDWAKEWSAKRDRSLSWAVNHFIKERRNRELAEKHLGKQVVR